MEAVNQEIEKQICDLESQVKDLQQKLAQLHQSKAPEEVENFEFEGPNGPLNLLELFGDREKLILIHNMGKGCSYCTLWADGFNGFTEHLNNRAAFVLTSPDDFKTLSSFAEARGWRFPYYSTKNLDFTKAMGFYGKYGSEVDGKEGPWPGVSTFFKKDGKVYCQTSAGFGPGDLYCSVWPLFDLLPKAESHWNPKFNYN